MSDAEVPRVDREAVADIRRYDQPGEPSAIDLFVEMLEQVETQLRLAVDNHNKTELDRILHRLCGTCGAMSAQRLSRLAGRWQQRLQTGHDLDLGALSVEMVAEIRATMAALQAL